MSALKDIRSFVSIAMFLTAVAMWVGAVMTIVASRGSDQFVLRLPDGLRDEIKEAAKANGRSMNAEIVSRLQGSGKTLRDEFAAQALQGHLAYGYAPRNPDGNWHQEISKEAYEIADAMLAARQQQGGGND